MNFNREKYGRILIPMVTPFQEDQSLDLDKAHSLARFLTDSGRADTLILCGTTGEFATMTFDERVALFKTVMDGVGGEIPLIAGVGCASTVETIKLAQKAAEVGYETVMVIAPYFSKPNQEQIYEHFRLVAEAVDINVMLYNIPIFTGINIEPETLSKLAEIDNIVAIKDEAELNPKQVTAYLNATPEEFTIYNGDDTMILETFAQGGGKRIGGVVSGASHLLGHQIKQMIEDFLSGNVQKAADMQRRIFPLLRIMGQNKRTNPVALWKEAMKLGGLDGGIPRLPFTRGTEREIAEVEKVMQTLNLIQLKNA